MDDIASRILHGCKLAGELEANLPNLLNESQHNLLIESCEQVVETFSKAIQQLSSSKVDRSSGHGFIEIEKTFEATIGQDEDPLRPAEKPMRNPDTSESIEMMIKPRIAAIQPEEEDPSTNAVVMLIGSSEESSFGEAASMASNETKKKEVKRPLARTVSTSQRPLSIIQWLLAQEEKQLAQTESTSQPLKERLQSKSKKRDATNVMRVPVQDFEQMHKVVNDDGYTWRVYGHKNILGAFPRSYYRCTHRLDKGCHATKRVQRLQEDPTTAEIFYYGVHTCGGSFSTPCNTPPTNLEHNTIPPTNLEHNQQSQSQSISIQLGTCSSGEVQCSATKPNVHSKDKTRDDCDSSGSSSVHIRPQTAATYKEKDDEATVSQWGD